MSINTQDKTIKAVYKGSVSISQVYKGEKLVFSAIDPLSAFIENCEAIGGDSDLIRTCYNAIDPDIRNNAAVLLFPSAVAQGIIYGMDTTTGDLVPFTFERQSIATAFDKQLNMGVVAIDTPRIDFVYYSKDAKLLIEKEATNSIINSNLSSNTSGSGSKYSIIADTWDNRLDGISNAAKIVLPTTNSYSYYYRQTTVVREVKAHYTVSSFVKNENLSPVIIGRSYPSGGDCLFTTGSSDSYETDIKVSDLGEGLYLVSTVCSSEYIASAVSIGFTKNFVTRDLDFYYSGIQQEKGDIATSYIPTSSKGATRSADKLSIVLSKETEVHIKTTTQELSATKPVGTWNIHEDLTQSDGILYLAIMK